MSEKRKFYLTKEGLEKIKNEYRNLLVLKLSKSRSEVPKILESEDLNPEYLSFQEDLDLLESRLTDLDYILKNSELVQIPPKEKQNIVGLGAKVLVEVTGPTDEFEIVGSFEANPVLGKISNESPVGKALLGHKVGDRVIVSSPIKTPYFIKKINYAS